MAEVFAELKTQLPILVQLLRERGLIPDAPSKGSHKKDKEPEEDEKQREVTDPPILAQPEFSGLGKDDNRPTPTPGHVIIEGTATGYPLPKEGSTTSKPADWNAPEDSTSSGPKPPSHKPGKSKERPTTPSPTTSSSSSTTSSSSIRTHLYESWAFTGEIVIKKTYPVVKIPLTQQHLAQIVRESPFASGSSILSTLSSFPSGVQKAINDVVDQHGY